MVGESQILVATPTQSSSALYRLQPEVFQAPDRYTIRRGSLEASKPKPDAISQCSGADLHLQP
jgi:hypothetical protein